MLPLLGRWVVDGSLRISIQTDQSKNPQDGFPSKKQKAENQKQGFLANQWPFQDPKLEVPTIYIYIYMYMYIRPI